MRVRFVWAAALLGLAVAVAAPAAEYKTKHVFIVVMDGVRWMDTFGDPKHESIPHLYNDLRPQGMLFTHYYNRGITVTRQGHSTIISGTWQSVPNGGPRLTMPSLFEYLRDEKKIPPTKAWSIFGKAIYSFLPYSSHPAYGQAFAASHVSGDKDTSWNERDAEGDKGVTAKVIATMKQDQPDLVFVNYGYTDHSGHVAKDISEYQAAIRNCDEQMWNLWQAIQADPYYKDTTTVFFTNDHGRHTADFHGHGDHCDGCEHLMLLALGPDVKPGLVSDQEALEIDLAPTVGELLNVQTPLATGRVLTECLTSNLNQNRKEARTEAAQRAIALDKLCQRDLQQVVADWVLAQVKPETVATDDAGLLLMLGMIKAGARTDGGKYQEFVRKWVAAHIAEDPIPPVVGLVTMELPYQARTDWTPKVVAAATKLAAETPTDRAAALPQAAMVSLVGSLPVGKDLRPQALEYAKKAVALPAGQNLSMLQRARELVYLGRLLAYNQSNVDLEKAFILGAYPVLAAQSEAGGVWEDPLVSATALAALARVRGTPLLKEIGKAKAPLDLEAMKAITVDEANALTHEAKAPRRPLLVLLQQNVKDALQFSQDMLRYSVNAEGVVGDGSPTAMGGFLAGYEKLDWRYGGTTWPGAAKTPIGTVNMGGGAAPKPAGQ